MQEHELPPWLEIARATPEHLDQARSGLSDARDWLNSDWRPAGSLLTKADAAEKRTAAENISQAKALIDEAKSALHRVLDASASA